MLRGRGRAGGRSSRLLRAIKISQGSLKPPRTTRSAAISTPPQSGNRRVSRWRIHLCRHPQKSVSKSKVTPVVWYSPSAPLGVGSTCTTGSYPMSRPLFAPQIPFSCDVAFEFQCHKRGEVGAGLERVFSSPQRSPWGRGGGKTSRAARVFLSCRRA